MIAIGSPGMPTATAICTDPRRCRAVPCGADAPTFGRGCAPWPWGATTIWRVLARCWKLGAGAREPGGGAGITVVLMRTRVGESPRRCGDSPRRRCTTGAAEPFFSTISPDGSSRPSRKFATTAWSWAESVATCWWHEARMRHALRSCLWLVPAFPSIPAITSPLLPWSMSPLSESAESAALMSAETSSLEEVRDMDMTPVECFSAAATSSLDDSAMTLWYICSLLASTFVCTVGSRRSLVLRFDSRVKSSSVSLSLGSDARMAPAISSIVCETSWLCRYASSSGVPPVMSIGFKYSFGSIFKK
mmetsp:Transcript_53943/g.123279  ORF Transcript_53943/g.123279 Transcript_53943/m.123279 type:complete len:304 (-) Transcript_53943:8177-9088(-)